MNVPVKELSGECREGAGRRLARLAGRGVGAAISLLARAHGVLMANGVLNNLARRYREQLWRFRLASFGKGAGIYTSVVIHNPEKVRIGDNVRIAEFVHIWGGGGVDIGNDVIIASHVSITSLTHNPEASRFRESLLAGPVVVEDNVWLGSGATVMPGVRIGRGSIVGARSVVTKDVQRGVVVAGAPARVIRELGEVDRP